MAGHEPEAAPIGVLTTEHRDQWARIREELINFSDTNLESFEAIETSAFIMCLDTERPVTRDEHSNGCWKGNGRNRYFDKAMQFIVFDNGKAGFNGEHSNMEATITHRACEWICENLQNGTISEGVDCPFPLQSPSKLVFDLNPRFYQSIQDAAQKFDELSQKHKLTVVVFEGYGKGLIKTFGVSPDSYVQMAMQLAYFKMNGVSHATYETSGTR
jgi:carnitine O-acetyltransferase